MELYQILTIVGANLVVLMGFMGSVIALHIHTSKQISALQQNTGRQIEAIHQEMKDFHLKLCMIEERRK